MHNVLILRGEGRYADPWHDFAATSGRVADLAREEGLGVRVSGAVEEELASLEDVDLLVLMVGNPTRHGLESSTFAAAQEGFEAYARGGGSIWSHHVSATSFPHMPAWERVIGGRWVGGVSMHPEIGQAAIEVPDTGHSITRGLGDFTVWDERYTHLRISDAVRPLAFHEHEGVRHPVLWTHRPGPARVVYDALGHDIRSFDSPERQILLQRSLGWLLDGDATGMTA
ncbi:hypothetical protein BWO91_02255 [Plantibacter flavus]|uniref:ThuA domain-containing protein n=1 Tax=Plantibacter flavus TaxID=150123 RepID=UPI00099CF562|nr:ThuA domain-containing protein [Plantibacter flavus]AQX78976.1 hypothetical protein BWO91_02255 [Plantibacter flavus]